MTPGPLIIDKTEILPGEQAEVNIIVSRLPSGTRIKIWAHVYRSLVPGPTLLLMAGVHGDEINGIEIVRQALERSMFNQLKQGTVIAIPLLNVYGYINYRRGVPDGRDVNRSFPGSKSGSLASRVASAVTRSILPHVDYAIDFHTGGASRYNFPQIRYGPKDAGAVALSDAFAAPFTIRKAVIPKSFRKTASEMGIPVLVYEAGEAERLCGYSIEKGIEGMQRVLKHLDMTDQAPPVSHPQLKAQKTGWIRAPEAGMFLWTKHSGQKIYKGEPLGVINSPQGNRQRRIYARQDGFIIGHNNASVVHAGDALFHLAYNHEES